jgi:hypothetical protein
MEYCRKLDLKFDHKGIDVESDNLTVHGEYSMPQKYGLALQKTLEFISVPNATYDMKDSDKAAVIQCLPQSLLDIEVPEVWVLNIKPTESKDLTMLAPHVDKVRKCCLNIYVDPHGEKTTYWEYQHGKLQEKYSFVAQHGECWIMDSDQPHSVTLSPPHVRKAISVSFINTPYQEVIKHFV